MTNQSPTLDNLAVNVDFGALKARLARGEVHDPDFRALPRYFPLNHPKINFLHMKLSIHG